MPLKLSVIFSFQIKNYFDFAVKYDLDMLGRHEKLLLESESNL